MLQYRPDVFNCLTFIRGLTVANIINSILGGRISVILAAFMSVLSAAAWAQASYPTQPIRIINPSAPGSATDISARRLADGMTKILNTPITIESRPGAGGGIASEFVARAPADGYTLLVGSINTHGINSGLYKSLRYDPVKDFIPVIKINSFANVFVVNQQVKANSFPEFVALAKSRSAEPMTFASGGQGTTMHILGELIKQDAAIPYTHVPYPGSPKVFSDLIPGRVDSFFAGSALLKPFIDAGTLKPLAVSSSTRLPSLPNVPTMRELGLQRAEMQIWIGLFAPANTPANVIETLIKAARQVLGDPAIIQAFRNEGSTVEKSTQPEFAAEVQSEVIRWKKIGAELNLTN